MKITSTTISIELEPAEAKALTSILQNVRDDTYDKAAKDTGLNVKFVSDTIQNLQRDLYKRL